MSEKRFKEAKGHLAFSQALVDRMRASQQPDMAQQSPEMGAQQQPQDAPQTPQNAPQQAQPQEVPQTQVQVNPAPEAPPAPTAEPESGLAALEKSGQAIADAFSGITNFFKTNEQKQADQVKKLGDKYSKDLKDIKGELNKIIDG